MMYIKQLLFKLNEDTSFLWVVIRDDGERDSSGWSQPIMPLLHLHGRSIELGLINQLIPPSLLTDHVYTNSSAMVSVSNILTW
jgi:hypothetical protein